MGRFLLIRKIKNEIIQNESKKTKETREKISLPSP